jgi:hypothetical protein
MLLSILPVPLVLPLPMDVPQISLILRSFQLVTTAFFLRHSCLQIHDTLFSFSISTTLLTLLNLRS